MELLPILKFVAGGVGKKDLLPAMTHFVIEDGEVRSFNGSMAIASPIPFDINCKPKAIDLVKAIGKCTETASMSMTAAGRLSIKSGNFRALIKCVDESPLHVTPEGERIEIHGEDLLKAFRVLEDFIGEDASRSWATGILLRGHSAYATCNVVLVERWMQAQFPLTVVIPLATVREVIRVGEPPTHAQYAENSFTFHYSDGRWIRTQLLDATQWPDIDGVLAKVPMEGMKPVDKRIFEAMDSIKDFTDKEGRVFFNGDIVSTHAAESEDGASVEALALDMTGIYAFDMLKKLNGVATHADLTRWPQPCPFMGDMVRGVIIGRRL